MKRYKIKDKEYELLENYKDGFSLDIVTDLLTEYFDAYDYILGDWAYDKLRLKGFCEKKNKRFKKNINDFGQLKRYLKEKCAYECKYFVLKKVNE